MTLKGSLPNCLEAQDPPVLFFCSTVTLNYFTPHPILKELNEGHQEIDPLVTAGLTGFQKVVSAVFLFAVPHKSVSPFPPLTVSMSSRDYCPLSLSYLLVPGVHLSVYLLLESSSQSTGQTSSSCLSQTLTCSFSLQLTSKYTTRSKTQPS